MPKPTRNEKGQIVYHWTLDEARERDHIRREAFNAEIRAKLAPPKSWWRRCIEFLDRFGSRNLVLKERL